jgi:hypothetical protein
MEVLGWGGAFKYRSARAFLRTSLCTMNTESMAGAHEVQKVLKLGLSSIQDDLAIVIDPHACGRQGREHEAPST